MRVRRHVAFVQRPPCATISIAGCFFLSGESTMMSRDSPVISSTSPWTGTVSMRSWKRTMPPCLVRIDSVYGSQAITVRVLDMLPLAHLALLAPFFGRPEPVAWAEHGPTPYTRGVRSHAWIDRRSQALHEAIAAKLNQDVRLLEIARANLRRWLSANPAPALLEWRALLDRMTAAEVSEGDLAGRLSDDDRHLLPVRTDGNLHACPIGSRRHVPDRALALRGSGLWHRRFERSSRWRGGAIGVAVAHVSDFTARHCYLPTRSRFQAGTTSPISSRPSSPQSATTWSGRR